MSLLKALFDAMQEVVDEASALQTFLEAWMQEPISCTLFYSSVDGLNGFDIKFSTKVQTLIFEQFVELKALHGDFPPILRLTVEDPSALKSYEEYTGQSHGVPSPADRDAMPHLIETKLLAIFSKVASVGNASTEISPNLAKALKAATAVIAFGSHCE